MLAITQEPEAGAEQSRFGRLSETLRARSLSPSDGPLLGSRTALIDGATDARVFPTILLPYTFPAFRLCRCHCQTSLSAHTCLPGYFCMC